MKKIEAYQCSFCIKKVLKKRESMAKHESVCLKSPQRKSCLTCCSFEKHSDTYYNHNHCGNPGSTDYEITKQYCKYYNKELQKIQIECPAWIEMSDDKDKWDEIMRRDYEHEQMF